jgi:hypothetical protein
MAMRPANQHHMPPEQMLFMLEDFMKMISDCMQTGTENNLRSMKSLSAKACLDTALRKGLLQET